MSGVIGRVAQTQDGGVRCKRRTHFVRPAQAQTPDQRERVPGASYALPHVSRHTYTYTRTLGRWMSKAYLPTLPEVQVTVPQAPSKAPAGTQGTRNDRRVSRLGCLSRFPNQPCNFQSLAQGNKENQAAAVPGPAHTAYPAPCDASIALPCLSQHAHLILPAQGRCLMHKAQAIKLPRCLDPHMCFWTVYTNSRRSGIPD